MPKTTATPKKSDPLTELREHHRDLLHRAEYDLLAPALQANDGSERGAARDLGIDPHSRIQAAIRCNPLLRDAKRRGRLKAKTTPPSKAPAPDQAGE